jgi:IS605 OrfB family transposase
MADEHFITLKFNYSVSKDDRLILNEYFKLYNNCFNCTFNEIIRQNGKLSTANSTIFQKTLNNIPKEAILRQAAFLDAKSLFARIGNTKVIFGGRKLFEQRRKNLISHEDFVRTRTRSISMSGDSNKDAGNYIFKLRSYNIIDFCPNRNTNVSLQIQNDRKGNKKLLEDLIFALEKKIPVSYKLSQDSIYITFDLLKVKDISKYNVIKDRIFAIDMNPNYLGWSVIDWTDSDYYKMVDSGYISFKPLNDIEYDFKKQKLDSSDPKRIHINNKRRYEIVKAVQSLITKARHYGCELFVYEDLNIKPKDKGNGKNFNRLCNNVWLRGLLTNQIDKRCKLNGITPLTVFPQYSSFIGNLVYREEKLPDFVLASIEISRRGFEYFGQYYRKSLPVQKNVIFNDSEIAHDRVTHSLEELGCTVNFKSMKDLYWQLKKMKTQVRFRLEDVSKTRVLFSRFDKRKKTVKSSFVKAKLCMLKVYVTV